jgi:hypothetical protein
MDQSINQSINQLIRQSIVICRVREMKTLILTHTSTPTQQERHRGRSRYYGGYGGGMDGGGNGGSGGGDCGRPYYVQPWKDRAFGSPLEYRAIRPLPQAIVRAYAQLQSMSFQGLWPGAF